MQGHLTVLHGAMFGLHVDMPRLYETSFDLHLDAALQLGMTELRPRTCLGRQRRWPRFDGTRTVGQIQPPAARAT
jgi:hypothetical protein